MLWGWLLLWGVLGAAQPRMLDDNVARGPLPPHHWFGKGSTNAAPTGFIQQGATPYPPPRFSIITNPPFYRS